MAKEKKLKYAEIKIYNLNNYNIQLKELIDLGCNFETSETSTTKKIKLIVNNKPTCYHYLESSKELSFLIILNQLKKEIRDNSEFVLNCILSDEPNNTKYYEFSKACYNINTQAGLQVDYTDVWEADISHAYYRACYVLKFISYALYQKIVNKLTKHDRLRLLGCIATRKVLNYYEKGVKNEDKKELKEDTLLRSAWFKITNYIDSAMIDFKERLGKDFLFYWVDGIFFRGIDYTDIFKNNAKFLALDRVKRIYDIDFKIIPVEKFTLTNMGDYLEIKIKKQDKEKVYYPQKEQVYKYEIY
jgi:hypothetical protein